MPELDCGPLAGMSPLLRGLGFSKTSTGELLLGLLLPAPKDPLGRLFPVRDMRVPSGPDMLGTSANPQTWPSGPPLRSHRKSLLFKAGPPVWPPWGPLRQGSTNSGPWAPCSLYLIFVNRWTRPCSPLVGRHCQRLFLVLQGGVATDTTWPTHGLQSQKH